MSSFKCQYCGKEILDSPTGFITFCEHYPDERKLMKKKTIKDTMKKYALEGRIEKLEQALKLIQIWAEHYQDDIAESVLHDIERKCKEVLDT